MFNDDAVLSLVVEDYAYRFEGLDQESEYCLDIFEVAGADFWLALVEEMHDDAELDGASSESVVDVLEFGQ